MTETQRQHILAGGQLITDRQHDARYRCDLCRRPWVIPDLARDCEASHAKG